ncbi:MAG TPA: N-methyl-L-tryptophan oxidase [Ktedonobacterales bacterium]|nr:N-methyl-L-tryptophan oxidase [Ktedonobacterales bacterium]
MGTEYDAIVLGLGAMGSATLYQLARRGKRVLGLDQYAPPHTLGSTHGDTRITRQAIGEGAAYVPLTLRSYELWREIEQLTGQDLLTITGGLIMASQSSPDPMHGAESFLKTTIATAEQFGIAHSVLETDQIRQRFPQFHLVGDEIGYYEENAGFLRPERCIQAQLALAGRFGATIQTGEQVLSYESDATNSSVTIHTARGHYTAEKLVISAGPWVGSLLEETYARYFTVYRQVLYWFGLKGPIEPFLPGRFPIFIWARPNSSTYGFPAIDGPAGGIKIATEDYTKATTPDTVDRAVSGAEIRAMHEQHITSGFPDVGDICVKAVSCLYTTTPDEGFVLDTHPEHPQVIIASPCSGHGFKHSAAIGETLAQLVIDGKTHIDISRFSLRRFETKQP